jgi:hypothetical protein
VRVQRLALTRRGISHVIDARGVQLERWGGTLSGLGAPQRAEDPEIAWPSDGFRVPAVSPLTKRQFRAERPEGEGP